MIRKSRLKSHSGRTVNPLAPPREALFLKGRETTSTDTCFSSDLSAFPTDPQRASVIVLRKKAVPATRAGFPPMRGAMSRPDQSITFLRSFGYSVFRVPRLSAQPLDLLHRDGKD